MKIVATTSLPAVDRPNADRWNAARSRQKNGVFSGHYIISSSLPPERRDPWNAARLCQFAENDFWIAVCTKWMVQAI